MKQFLLYFCCAGLAAVVNFTTRILYDLVLGFDLSVCLGYITGIGFNFTLSKFLVFKAGKSGRTGGELLKFIIVALSGLLVTLLSTRFYYYLLGAWDNFLEETGEMLHIKMIVLRKGAAHAAGIGTAFIYSFIGHKYFSFLKRSSARKQ
ncbi:MAG TPA: GtrA family protein [Spirochaetota bacterium]|nr:GtrA family protein [Spirochaetota bacterium]